MPRKIASLFNGFGRKWLYIYFPTQIAKLRVRSLYYRDLKSTSKRHSTDKFKFGVCVYGILINLTITSYIVVINLDGQTKSTMRKLEANTSAFCAIAKVNVHARLDMRERCVCAPKYCTYSTTEIQRIGREKCGGVWWLYGIHSLVTN